MPAKFRVRTIPLIATVLLVTLGVALGQWQVHRAQQKEALAARMVARSALPPLTVGSAPMPVALGEYRRLVVSGEFRADWPLYLDNRPHDGAAGFYVLMPLRIAGSDRYLLVARGWTPRNITERTRIQPVSTPVGMVRIEGVGRRNPGRLLQLGHAQALHPGAILQNLDIEQLAVASGLALQPFVLEQSSDTGDGLLRDWPLPSSGAATNWGYAFQWYALALMALLFFIITGFRHGNK